MKKVLISAPYMLREKQKVKELLTPYNFDITWADVEERLEEDDLLPIVGEYEGIICGDDRITSKVYDAAKNLSVVVKWGTGIDSLNKSEADKRGIKLFRTPGAFSEPVADTTLAYMLAFCRGVATNDRLMKNGRWDKPQGYTLGEKKVGLIGFGDIGVAVAKRLKGFGVTILANDLDPEKNANKREEYGVTFATKEEIYETCDIISLHCDLNETSYHLINQEAFLKMKRRPILINSARGPLIEEKSLLGALKDNVIEGVALDVFEDEPLDVNSDLRKMDNVFLASHNSNSSPQCWMNVHKNSINMLAKGLELE
jgi:D-3-phosphoglycerate dehydrogenase / 2-oxoglutarate reductase